jgi:hypothetical protein
MRTIHHGKHGKSLLKGATKLKPRFARDSSVHLVKLTMILQCARDNAHGIQVIPAKLEKIGQEVTKDGQNADLSRIERILHGKGMMHMDDPGITRALIAKITTILLSPIENHLAKPGNFMNALTHTTNLMRGITSNTVCPDDHARKQRRA